MEREIKRERERDRERERERENNRGGQLLFVYSLTTLTGKNSSPQGLLTENTTTQITDS